MTRPLVVGVIDELRHPGSQRPVTVAGSLGDLGLSTASVPAEADVHADLVLEAMVDRRLTATGTIRAPWVGECRRCLQLVEGELSVRVQEVFEPNPLDGDTYPLESDRVDLEPMIRDAVLLALPLAPLCRDDCPGPDPEHPVSVVDDAASAGQPADPRWAGLRQLRFD